jgi:Zn-finger nucleic acid-binding protein
MVRNCPRCKIEMQLLRVNEIELDACPKCMGIWFDSSELDKIIGSKKSFEEEAYLSKPLGGNIDCPSCRQKMGYLTINNTTIDFCKTCEGIWLDAGELTELAGHLPEPKVTEDNAPYKIEIKESDGFLHKIKNIFSKNQ